MTGLLINDPYATFSKIYLNMPNGSFTLTVPGLAYFSEHMASGGSKKYPNIFPTQDLVKGGIYNVNDNPYTRGEFQAYYIAVPFTFLFEEAIDFLMILLDIFYVMQTLLKKKYKQ